MIMNNIKAHNEHYSQGKEVFQFKVPTEAPVFQPTEEEFLDPLAYIAKIRPIAEKTGICKIKPPEKWQPPFAVDVDQLRFTPRIQRLNELEATTRVKLNFLDQIAKFWELQGSSQKIPIVERRPLDLYTLHRVVKNEGGFDEVTKQKKWCKVSDKLGYQIAKNVGTILKQHYERLLYPFDVFTEQKKVPATIRINEDGYEIPKPTDKLHAIVNPMAVKPLSEKNARSSSRFENTENDKTRVELEEQKCEDAKNQDEDKGHDSGLDQKDDGNKDKSKELKRLQFLRPGPKIALYDKKKEFAPRARHTKYNVKYSAKYICCNCNRDDSEEQMLLCHGCDDSYHTFCLIPHSTKIRKRHWRCPRCVAEEVSQHSGAFGFEQAGREYTLQQFQDMADSFKSDYFNMPTVPTSEVEREFWRIVSSIDEDVTVEYGADLHTMDHGSGFPTKSSANLFEGDKEYAESSWNLNNLPVLKGSVLGYINDHVSGMTVPWMYVGMCFATFCWHNEDHWSYSINYLHWGDDKTWYGVPGSKAENFEETMKSAAPELFHSQPDLLHQLVTIMNPNVFMNAGVPVYRTDQHAGEFVVTFPRAYHTGFNQGYNFAEAVNFAPANWLRMGRECMLHYSNLRRFCVFAHDELVCKIALDHDNLDSTTAAATYQDMLVMVDTEKKLRKRLLDWGVTNAEREAFELLPDDQRQCEICKTTCYLSAVTCSCTSDALVCPRHYENLCGCPPANKTLIYRYTLDELPIMLNALKRKAESSDNWVAKVKNALDPNTPKTLHLNDLKALLDQADRNKIPEGELRQTLTNAVIDAEKCISLIRHFKLALDKVSTRSNHSNEIKCKLPIESLKSICDKINSLACVLDEDKNIKALLTNIQLFGAKSKDLLRQSLQQNSLIELEECLNHGNGLCMDHPNLRPMSTRIKQVQFMRRVETYKKKSDMEVDSIEALIEQGYSLPPHDEIKEELSNLQSIVHNSKEWEQRAQEFLKCKDPNILTQGEKLLKEASNIPCHLPTASIVSAAIKNGREWLKQLLKINSAEYYPYYSAIEELITEGRQLVIHLEEVDRLNEDFILAKAWKEKTSRVFLRKDSPTTLIDALAPRTDYSKSIVFTHTNPATVESLFKEAEKREMSMMRIVRQCNQQKSLEPNDLSFSYCICGRGVFGVMMRCELCLDWFHSTCTDLPKIGSTKFKNNVLNFQAASLRFEGCKYLCCNCQRSKRPRLVTILSLLKSLQKLHVRVPEGEALHRLTERAMNWQDRARQLLLTPELKNAKMKVNNLLQKVTEEEAAASQKTEKIFTNEMKRAFKNPELHQRIHESSRHLPRNEVENYVVRISPEVRSKMEELLMEGDLLEVSLDETETLWKLMLSSRDHDREVMLIDFDAHLKASPKKQDRKRLSEDPIDSAKKTPKTAKVDEEKKIRGRKEQTLSPEENCAADWCQKPSGEIVDWVECDAGCEQWFHVACVNLSVEEINRDNYNFTCPTCFKRSRRSSDLTQPSTSKGVS